MLKLTEIQNAVAHVLKTKSGFRVYKSDVIEAYKAPCFFIDCTFNETEMVNLKTFQKTLSVSIFYFGHIDGQARSRDEIDNETMICKLADWFSPNFKVEDRYLTTSNQNFVLGGELGDVVRFNFQTQFLDTFDTNKSKEEGTINTIQNFKANTKFDLNT